jgi:hypothetical protein
VRQDVFQHPVVELDLRRERIGVAGLPLFVGKVEQPGVVLLIRLPEQHQQILVDLLAVGRVAQRVFGLDAALLADPQEDDPVDRRLHRAVDLAPVQAGVAQRHVARQVLAPALHFFQKSVVHVRRAFFTLQTLGELVERSLHHRLARENRADLVPFFNEILK